MSHHGKSLWSEVARRRCTAGFLALATRDRSGCANSAFVGVYRERDLFFAPVWHRMRMVPRESAALDTHDQSTHHLVTLPRIHLAGITFSERGSRGLKRRWPRD